MFFCFQKAIIKKGATDENTSYVGFYADVDYDGNVDGVIYADLAIGTSATGDGQWGDEWGPYGIEKKTGLKNYKVEKIYTGTNNLGITKAIVEWDGTSTGKDRFYVMALRNNELNVRDLYKKLESDITNYNRKSVV